MQRPTERSLKPISPTTLPAYAHDLPQILGLPIGTLCGLLGVSRNWWHGLGQGRPVARDAVHDCLRQLDRTFGVALRSRGYAVSIPASEVGAADRRELAYRIDTKRLERELDLRGLSRSAAAREAGVDEKVIRKAIAGRRLALATVEALARLCHERPEDLIDWREPYQPALQIFCSSGLIRILRARRMRPSALAAKAGVGRDVVGAALRFEPVDVRDALRLADALGLDFFDDLRNPERLAATGEREILDSAHQLWIRPASRPASLLREAFGRRVRAGVPTGIGRYALPASGRAAIALLRQAHTTPEAERPELERRFREALDACAAAGVRLGALETEELVEHRASPRRTVVVVAAEARVWGPETGLEHLRVDCLGCVQCRSRNFWDPRPESRRLQDALRLRATSADEGCPTA